jgi:TolB-like protein/DNA-binding winged helix-turn-helix (wHTH) protein/Flp pilus assembly protein TadD
VGFDCYSIGDLLLDVGTHEVTRDGAAIPVPRLSYLLLLSLARHAPNVVTAEQLGQEVWSGLVVDRGTINKRVLLLRKSLGEGPDTDPYITVIRGSGYRLVAPVERLQNSSAEMAGQQPAKKSGHQHNSSLARVVSYGLLGLIIVFSLYKGFQGVFVDPDQRVATSGPDRSQLSTVVYSQNSVAVLPFVDLKDGKTHQYIGDGIAEEIINLLSAMDGLNVAARTSSFSFRDTSSTVAEIAAKLKVGNILEGSIRHIDDQIRVSAQLIDSHSGHHIWSQDYDRSFDQVFEVQDDIAFNIAQSLKLTLDQVNHMDSRKQMTGDIEAFKLYLKGRELLNDRIHLRTAGLQAALVNFSKAVERDPKFARAHAGIASVYWLLTTYDSSLDREHYFEKAEESANFALAIDPESSEAMSTLAAVSSHRGNIIEAARYFDQIRALNRDDSNIIAWEATLHIRLGYFDEMTVPLLKRYERDPLNEHIAWALADVLIYSGRPREAIEILQELEHFTYRDYYLGLCAIYLEDYPTAREFLRDTQMRSGSLPASYADSLIDAMEDPSLFEDTVRTFLSAAENGTLGKTVSFEALLMLGSPEAFSLDLDPNADIVKLQIHAQIWNSWAVNLRRDPRFKDWVSALGYVEFWRQFGWPDRCRPTGLDDFECV